MFKTLKDVTWPRPGTLVLVGLALAATLTFRLVEHQSDPRTHWAHDRGVISSVAAAKDHPDLFRNDFAYNNPSIYRFYTPAFVGLIRFLKRLTGSYYSAFSVQLEPIALLLLFGFYVLARQWTESRTIAALYSAVVFGMAPGFWDYWGFGTEESLLPREWFAAYLPWILTAAWRWRERPERWPWLCVLVSLAVYIHPVSAPGLGVGMALYLLYQWSQLPSGNNQRLIVRCAVGLVLPALPYVIAYTSFRDPVITNPDGVAMCRFLAYRVFAWWYEMPRILSSLMGLLRTNYAMATLGLVALLLSARVKRTAPAAFALAIWILGFLVVAALSFVDYYVARHFRTLPFEFDLFRSIRYFFPLALAAYVIGFSAAGGIKSRLRRRVVRSLCCVLPLCLWGYRFFPRPWIEVPASWAQGHLMPPARYSQASLQSFLDSQQAVSRWVPSNRVLYAYRRPDLRCEFGKSLYFYYGDLNNFMYTHLLGIGEMLRRQHIERAVEPATVSHFSEVVKVLQNEKVDYWLAQIPLSVVPTSQRGQVLWHNAEYVLVSLERNPKSRSRSTPPS